MIADRSGKLFRGLKPLPGILWTLALVLPWFVAVMLRSGGGFMQESMGQDLIGKLFSGQESHGAPPGFYWLLFWVTFWPAAPLAVMATDFAWNERLQPQVRFLIAWILPSWLVLEAVATKLPHYVLPLYPAIAILIALALEKRAEVSRLAGAALALWPVFAALFGGLAVFVAYRYGGAADAWLWLAAVLPFASAAAAFVLFRNGLQERGLLFALLSSALAGFVLYTALLRGDGLFLSPRIVEAASTNCGPPQITSSGFNEPSLVFLGGTDVRFLRAAEAAKFLTQPGCRVAAVTARELAAFREAANSLGLGLNELGRVRGFNYSDGRDAEVLLFSARANGAAR